MNCERCLLTRPPRECEEDCDECDWHDPTEIPYPCCTCLRWEATSMDKGTEFERWIKSEVELYNRIVHEGPLDKYTPQGHTRLVQIFAIATRMSEKLIQKKTMINALDPALQERINHYTTLYGTTIRYTTADNYDTAEDVLNEAHQILHHLMMFLNQHYELNYNLQPKPETKTGPTTEQQMASIQKAIEDGARPRPC